MSSQEAIIAEVSVLKQMKEILAARLKEEGGADAWDIKKDLFEDTLVRRMIVVPSFEVYGGVAGLYDLGPPGCALKDNIIQAWRRHFVLEENMLQVECTTLTPHQVLKTSGHVDKFADFMVRDEKTGECFRADKLLEEHIEKVLEGTAPAPHKAALLAVAPAEADAAAAAAAPAIPDGPAPPADKELREELQRVHRQADAYNEKQLHDLFGVLGIKTSAGDAFSFPFAFNLMFQTKIGPSGQEVGYLRPETAQSIFMNFPRLLNYNNDRMPFAAAQVGLAFRNEIAPRNGLLRVREFTMAEIEHFVDPEDKKHPRFAEVAGNVLTLFPQENQLGDGKTVRMSAGAAVEAGIIANETLAYFMARTDLFLQRIGIRPEGLRFRQHLKTEMAHYACDCWDAEILMSVGWVECVGHADRACYDLKVHMDKTGTAMTANKRLDKPVDVTTLQLKPNSKVLNPLLGDNKAKVFAAFKALAADQGKLAELQALVEAAPEGGEVPLDCDGEAVLLPAAGFSFKSKTKKVTVEAFLPSVIEPSFGVGRIINGVLEHAFVMRASSAKEKRYVLSIPALVAPIKAVVLPLDKRVDAALVRRVRGELMDRDLATATDESSVSIGKRYARFDEVGAAFAITIDFDSSKDDCVTLRERDSAAQVRVPIPHVSVLVADLCAGRIQWSGVVSTYPVVTTGEDKVAESTKGAAKGAAVEAASTGPGAASGAGAADPGHAAPQLSTSTPLEPLEPSRLMLEQVRGSAQPKEPLAVEGLDRSYGRFARPVGASSGAGKGGKKGGK